MNVLLLIIFFVLFIILFIIFFPFKIKVIYTKNVEIYLFKFKIFSSKDNRSVFVNDIKNDKEVAKKVEKKIIKNYKKDKIKKKIIKKYFKLNDIDKIFEFFINILQKIKFKKIEIIVYRNNIQEVILFSSLIPIIISLCNIKINNYKSNLKLKSENNQYIECIFKVKIVHIIYVVIKYLLNLKKRGNFNGKTSYRKFNGVFNDFFGRND